MSLLRHVSTCIGHLQFILNVRTYFAVFLLYCGIITLILVLLVFIVHAFSVFVLLIIALWVTG
jgi:hypothetical protein